MDVAFDGDGIPDDAEWETASDSSDIEQDGADTVEQQLASQISPLEDIIQRSLSALGGQNLNQQQRQNIELITRTVVDAATNRQQQQQLATPSTTTSTNNRQSPDNSVAGVLPPANETPSGVGNVRYSSAQEDSGNHVIGLNQRTVDFMTALDRQFYLPLNAGHPPSAAAEQQHQDSDTASTKPKSPSTGKKC